MHYAASCRVICAEGLQVMLFRFGSVAALSATASMVAAPLAAADLPRIATPASVATSAVFDADSVNADEYRRWRHRDRVDAGDVIAGVAVVGVIAALASAVSKQSRVRNERRTQGYPYPERPYDYRAPSDSHYDDSRGIDRAVDSCAREVERNGAIDTIDTVERTGSGWRVAGRMQGGSPFNCSVGNDGRIEGVDTGRIGALEDRQWGDERYAAARQAEDATAAPAYPGGPIPGENADDGRYDTAQAPDTEG
jgi:hypothetical protein